METEVEVKGRMIKVRPLIDTQAALMGREAAKVSRLSRKIDGDNIDRDALMDVFSSMGRILDIIESTVVDPDDREFLVNQMATGNLAMKDITPLMKFEDQEQNAAPVVRRGRPRRTK